MEIIKYWYQGFLLMIILGISSCSRSDYQGQAWNNTRQQIPGRVECEYFDLGGEGIAYHDTDSINNGSGRLNPVNGTLLNEFRMDEGVDISYTKSGGIDNSPYNWVDVEMGQLYVGWTEPGEWINYSVQVKKSGMYQVGLMFTANADGGIALDLNGETLTDELFIPASKNVQDTIAMRHWHHWNRIDSLTTVHLKKGNHILTLKTVTHGNMNYDYLDFKAIH